MEKSNLIMYNNVVEENSKKLEENEKFNTGLLQNHEQLAEQFNDSIAKISKL
jgi:hypothetical protein